MNAKLTTIILDAIKQEDEYNPSWTTQESIQYAYNRFKEEEGNIAILRKESYTQAATNWFQGLALHVPYWDDEIEELGFNPETYWKDLACTLILMNQLKHHLP